MRRLRGKLKTRTTPIIHVHTKGKQRKCKRNKDLL